MPSSLQARTMRSAISPRFAMSTFFNIQWDPVELGSFNFEERLAVFDRFPVLDE